MFEFLNGSVFPFSESSTDEPNIGGFEMTEEDDAMMEAFEAIPCNEDDIDDAMMRIALESVENYHMIVEAIMMDEFNEYVATNEEVVYEEGRIKKITSAISSFVQNAWQKIKGVFEKVFDTIASAVKSDERFLKDNEKKIKKYKGELEVKGYKFQNLGTTVYTNIDSAFMSNVRTKLESTFKNSGDDADYATGVQGGKTKIKSLTKMTEELPGILRKAVLGEDCDAGDFSKKLKKFFAGSDDKVTLKISPEQAIKEIRTAKATKDNAKKSYDNCKTYFNNLLKKVRDIEKKAIGYTSRKDVKENKVAEAVGCFSKAVKTSINIATITMRAQIAAINANYRQYKAAAVEMARGGGSSSSDTKSTNESALDLIQLF